MTDGAHYHLFDTAIGQCGVAWNGRGLIGVQLPEKDLETTGRRLAAKSGSTPGEPPAWVMSLIGDIRKYLAGEAKADFSKVAVDLGDMDELRKAIYTALRGVKFGRSVTYGDLAKQIGLEGWEAARDVGAAMGSNRVPIVIPCHRVLAAGNKPGGFSAYGGVKTKQKLLALEGVSLDKPEKPNNEPPRLPGL
jgi:methylated-DNA-[protein]-cysteine S-methyltransferase